MNVAKLELLADILEVESNMAPKKTVKFDLQCWVASATPDEEPDDYYAPDEEPDDYYAIDCGTQACAIGVAALSKKFAGLEIHNGMPYYGGQWGWDAVRACFDLKDMRQAFFLFSGDHYTITRGPRAMKAIAKRIRETIAHK